jgi:hypothetical protein
LGRSPENAEFFVHSMASILHQNQSAWEWLTINPTSSQAKAEGRSKIDIVVLKEETRTHTR